MIYFDDFDPQGPGLAHKSWFTTIFQLTQILGPRKVKATSNLEERRKRKSASIPRSDQSISLKRQFEMG